MKIFYFFLFSLFFHLPAYSKLSKDQIEITKERAEKGDTDSILKLALYYKESPTKLPNEPRDILQAMSWFKIAFRKGNGEGAFYLGEIYSKGLGTVPKSYTQAVKWYKKALKKNYYPAGMRIADLYLEKGPGWKPDYVEAANWYRQMAHKGLAEAQFMMAFLHFKGQGVEQNRIRAYVWLHQASQNPIFYNKNYQSEIQPLEVSLKQEMSSDELARAEKMAQSSNL